MYKKTLTAVFAATALVLGACDRDTVAPEMTFETPAFDLITDIGSWPDVQQISLPTVNGDVCPQVEGWGNHQFGSASGPFGSITWAPGGQSKNISWNLNAGWKLYLCVKPGNERHGYLVTGASARTLSYENGVSHYSYMLEAPPTRPYSNLAVLKTALPAYDSMYAWTLTKSVNGGATASFVGSPGQSFNANWLVTATRTQALELNHRVTGAITISNANPTIVNVSVADVMAGANVGSSVEISCTGMAGPYLPSPVAAAVPAGVIDGAAGELVCYYRSMGLTDRNSTANQATVTVISYDPVENFTGSIGGGIGSAPINWAMALFTRHGVATPLLADARAAFGPYSQSIANTTTLSPVEVFTCPSIEDHNYASNFTLTAPNTATLTGAGTPPLNLSASATVNLTCAANWTGESATGRGTQWPGTNNWFQYNVNGNVDLVYGRTLQKAGNITMSTVGGSTTITITLDAGFRLKAGSGSVKIEPLSSAPTKYIQPGKFTYHGASLVVTVPNAPFYGIHLDIERMVP
jgi:hypothetical protein